MTLKIQVRITDRSGNDTVDECLEVDPSKTTLHECFRQAAVASGLEEKDLGVNNARFKEIVFEDGSILHHCSMPLEQELKYSVNREARSLSQHRGMGKIDVCMKRTLTDILDPSPMFNI